MIDIWLIGTMIIPFAEVFLHTIINVLDSKMKTIDAIDELRPLTSGKMSVEARKVITNPINLEDIAVESPASYIPPSSEVLTTTTTDIGKIKSEENEKVKPMMNNFTKTKDYSKKLKTYMKAAKFLSKVVIPIMWIIFLVGFVTTGIVLKMAYKYSDY